MASDTNEIIKLIAAYPMDTRLTVAHDGFSGTVRGYYVTREGKPGLVLQQNGNRVVHVYGEKWFTDSEIQRRRDVQAENGAP